MGERPRVVVGVDGSTWSRAALRFALEDAARRGQGVQVVSVLLPPEFWPEAYGVAGPPTVAAKKDDLRAAARRMVDEVVAKHPGLAAVPVELHELVGRPAQVLIDRARGADVLVIGHRGRGGFASALLGSVGLQCVLHAECPVVVVRPVAQAVADGTASNEIGAAGVRTRAGSGAGAVMVGPLY